MKVKVIVRYVDRETHEMCDLGEVKEYLKERAEELIKGGYVVKYKATEKTKQYTLGAERRLFYWNAMGFERGGPKGGTNEL